MALIRALILGLLAYGAIAVSYPDWKGEIYHVVMISAIAGGAVAVWFLDKILDLGSGAAKVLLELSFPVGILLFAGYTMPQKSGKPPLTQFAEGVRPTRDSARRGFSRLGVDPNGPVASRVVDLFPKR
ncbi:MAG: hypothetical protein HYV14_17300 [Elusimicrobia bacterium]|nr:hypothetical protein [Elusimicrobiota bacterium]